MKFEDLFDIEKIKEEKPELLLLNTVSSLVDLAPIKLTNIEMNNLAYAMPRKADFSKIEPHIAYEKKDGMFEISVPTFDERELPEFKVRLFKENDYDCFPLRGFYVTGNATLIVKPLGLVKVEMKGLPIVRVDKDIRYTQPSSDVRERGYSKNLYFYFDYNSKTYEKVYPDKLEECKFKMEKDPKAVEKYHESVQEYIKREICLEAIEERIYQLSIGYLPKLSEWKDSKYGDGGITIGSLTKYLNDYKRFLQDTMTPNLQLMWIYAKISEKEFEKLIEKSSELQWHIKKAFEAIDRIKEINSLTKGNENDYELTTETFSEEENQLVKIIEKQIIATLEEFKEVRPSKFPSTALSKEKILKGYIGYDLEAGEVYPSVLQVQRRSSLTEEKEDFRSEADYTGQIIKELIAMNTKK